MRVAILGAGFMGSTHAHAWRSLPETEIAAIYAKSGKRATPLADELGTVWTSDLEAVLNDDTVEAVDICLPTPWHRETAEAALAAGKHVLLEKPIALSATDAAALADAADASGQVLMVAHVLRFWPEYVELNRLLASGEFGPPRSALATRRQAFPAWSEIFARSEITGGAVIDMMIHDFDALNWSLGIPIGVTARGRLNRRSSGFDQVQVMIDYESGASALLDGGLEMPDSYPFGSRFEVLCDNGALEYHFSAGGRSFEEGTAGVNTLSVYPGTGEATVVPVEQVDPFAAEIADFAGCIRDGVAPARVTVQDAVLALHVALAARESLENGGSSVAIG